MLFMTVRERILEFLESREGEFFTAEEIARSVGEDLSPSEVYAHIAHIAKTVRRAFGGRAYIAIKYPVCLKCGYVIRVSKPKKPSRCPRCRSTWVSEPEFAFMMD